MATYSEDDLSQVFLGGRFPISQRRGPAAPSVRKYYSYHPGTDIATPVGTPIKVPFSAKLSQAGDQGLWGKRVGVTNPKTGENYIFSHLSQIPNLSQDISAGSIIGYTGNTGRSTGPHVDIMQSFGQALANAVKPFTNTVSNVAARISSLAPRPAPRSVPRIDANALLAKARQSNPNVVAISSNPARLTSVVKKYGGRIVRIKV